MRDRGGGREGGEKGREEEEERKGGEEGREERGEGIVIALHRNPSKPTIPQLDS